MLLSLSHASIQAAVYQQYIKPHGIDHEAYLHRLIAGRLTVVVSLNVSLIIVCSKAKPIVLECRDSIILFD